MKISKVVAHALNVPIEIDICDLRQTNHLGACVVEIETDEGLKGCGLTAITEVEVVAAAINKIAAEALVGEDPCNTEKLWEKLYWLMAPRGQTGYALHAIAALDIALWDIKGQALGQPVWKLLGGARSIVPVYATFGFRFFGNEVIGDAAKLWVEQGYRGLKMTVGDGGLRRRDEPRPLHNLIEEDVERVARVREAVGPNIKLFVDANCNLDPYHAIQLAREIEQYRIEFFEEPITQNDVRRLADLRQRTTIPVAAGQNEGLSYRFRDLMIAGAVDIVQPNVAITGGYTQCTKIAGMAQAFNVGIDNGGAWPHFNMHLHAGLANGGLVEMHYIAVELCKSLFDGLPEAKDGSLALPTLPGLGFTLNQERLGRIKALS
ncbi:mandelate racemase/muconate lactonizing enzyme family protein [Sulfitobacter sp. AS92]|uniref:mandelate racemase/muconate lactonizing enzyme family protein n=1 Tax=Sulfitobacter sp. AS92 TaxID=3135783 RepID=UPI00316B204C